MSRFLGYSRQLLATPRLAVEVGLRCFSTNAVAYQPKLCSLEGVRSVVRLSGVDLFHFLQGLVTNDVLALEQQTERSMYACILNAQGRFLHDMMLYRAMADAKTILADVDHTGLGGLLRLLKRYKLHAKVDVADVSTEYGVWTRFDGPMEASTSGITDWVADPRLPLLGLRAVFPRAQPPVPSAGEAVVDAAAFQQWRVELGVAEGIQEIPTGEAIALEYNIDWLHGISFHKGCYIGQELMARAHFQGQVRKRLMPVQLSSVEGLEVGKDIINPISNKSVGKLRTWTNSGAGLAVLRLDNIKVRMHSFCHIEEVQILL